MAVASTKVLHQRAVADDGLDHNEVVEGVVYESRRKISARRQLKKSLARSCSSNKAGEIKTHRVLPGVRRDNFQWVVRFIVVVDIIGWAAQAHCPMTTIADPENPILT